MKIDIIDRQILAIALPSVVTNVTVPLLGLCDIAIAGHVGDASLVAAVSVGATLFNVLYWVFGFLRMGTGGLTSQAYGRKDEAAAVEVMARSLFIGLVLSIFLLAAHPLLFDVAFSFIIDTEPRVEALSRAYLSICIWGAPAVMLQYCFTGWFIGMQNSRIPMAVSILQNVANIALSLAFVLTFGMGIEGIALGTMLAQWLALCLSFASWLIFYGKMRRLPAFARLFDAKPMLRFIDLNKDIFIRTLCLVAVTLFFTSAGAAQGEMTVAANALLMQFFTFFSYIMDGLAYAAEALAGKFIGACDSIALRRTVARLFRWSFAIVAAFTLVYLFAGKSFIALLTSDANLIEFSMDYFPWVLLIPLAGFQAFIWDGVYIGATATRHMLLAMVVATVAFFSCYGLFFPLWRNHALWMSFLVYLFIRGIIQTLVAKRAVKLLAG